MADGPSILITAGAAAIILAVVGGGARAFGVEVPVIGSRHRQVLLAVVGVVFLGGGVVLDWKDPDNGNGTTTAQPDPKVAAYRQHVLVACDALAAGTGTLPPSELGFDGLTYQKDDFLRWMRDERRFIRRTLTVLWKREVPESLAQQQEEARAAGAKVVSGWAAAVEQLNGSLPARWTFQPPGGGTPAPLRQAEQELNGLAQELRGTLAALADAECGEPATEGSRR